MAQLDSFRSVRWIRTFHLVLQGVLLFTFLAGLNYVARDYPVRAGGKFLLAFPRLFVVAQKKS